MTISNLSCALYSSQNSDHQFLVGNSKNPNEGFTLTNEKARRSSMREIIAIAYKQSQNLEIKDKTDYLLTRELISHYDSLISNYREKERASLWEKIYYFFSTRFGGNYYIEETKKNLK